MGSTGTSVKSSSGNNDWHKMWNGIPNNEENYWNQGLDAYRTTNKYITMNRVNENEDKIVVRVADEHLKQTKYGYALILDNKNVVFIKDQQVNRNYYGNEVILNRQYWNVKQWGDWSNTFGSEPKNYDFKEWVKTAKAQEKAGTSVHWESHYHSPKTITIMKNISKSK